MHEVSTSTYKRGAILNFLDRKINTYSSLNAIVEGRVLSIHPATLPHEDFVQLRALEKKKSDRRKLKCLQEKESIMVRQCKLKILSLG